MVGCLRQWGGWCVVGGRDAPPRVPTSVSRASLLITTIPCMWLGMMTHASNSTYGRNSAVRTHSAAATSPMADKCVGVVHDVAEEMRAAMRANGDEIIRVRGVIPRRHARGGRTVSPAIFAGVHWSMRIWRRTPRFRETDGLGIGRLEGVRFLIKDVALCSCRGSTTWRRMGRARRRICR